MGAKNIMLAKNRRLSMMNSNNGIASNRRSLVKVYPSAYKNRLGQNSEDVTNSDDVLSNWYNKNPELRPNKL